MDLFSILQISITVAFSTIPWIFPSWPWYIKAIFTLAVLLLSLVARLLKYQQTNKQQLQKKDLKIQELEKLNQDISKRHTALAKRFDSKIEKERRFNMAFQNIGTVLHMSLLDNSDDKLTAIYKVYLCQQELIAGGNFDEQDEQDI